MLRKALAIAYKDLQIESGSKSLFTSLLLLSLILIFLSSFAVAFNPKVKPELSCVAYWLILISISFQTLNKSLASEVDYGCWDALCLCPVSLKAIFLGKFIYNTLIICVVELITFPLYLLFFNLKPSTVIILLPIFLVSFSFNGVGLFFALMSLRTSGKELAIQVTALPILLPALFIGLRTTLKLSTGALQSDFWHLILMLIVFDLIFIVIAFMAFDPEIIE